MVVGSTRRVPRAAGGNGRTASSNASSQPTCSHPSHRTVQLFMPYAEANAVRVRFVEAESSKRTTVSPLHRHGSGWSFTACGACLARHADNDERCCSSAFATPGASRRIFRLFDGGLPDRVVRLVHRKEGRVRCLWHGVHHLRRLGVRGPIKPRWAGQWFTTRQEQACEGDKHAVLRSAA